MLENDLHKLIIQVDATIEKIDTCITVDKMSQGQRDDLAAFMADNPDDLVNILHDYFGIRRALIQPDSTHAQTFLPRTSGYATKPKV